MQKVKIKTGSARLFENDLLERLSHVNPISPLIFWTPVLAYFLWRTFAVHQLALGPVLAIGLLGVITWTFFEYWLHRVVFHMKPKSAFMKRVHYIIHEHHHEHPDDPTRLVFPPAGAVILAIPLFLLFRAVWGEVWADPFFAFFLVGYLAYDYTHYAVHFFKPRTRWGRYWKNYHMQHHFVAPEAKWGISSPLWDYAFGTVEERTAEKTQRPSRA